MDRARRSRDASDEQEPKRQCLAGGRSGGAGGAVGGDAGDHHDARGGGGHEGDGDSSGDAGDHHDARGGGGDGSGDAGDHHDARGGGGHEGDGDSSGDAGGGGGVGHATADPLSTFGNDVLCDILSRLESSRQTVRMCMLSRTWRHLWRSVPSIHIDQREFGSDHQLQSFTDFLLERHTNLVLLDAFRLLLSTEDLRLPACQWVRRVISQDITPPYQLKRLHLCKVRLDKDFASHISDDRCPALEDVQLENCSYLTARYKITSFSLKRLVVDGFDMVQDDQSDDDEEDEIFNLIIEAPALVSLRLAGELEQIVGTTEEHTMPSLIDVSVHLPVLTDDELSDDEGNVTTAQQSVLSMLSNVTTLTLSHFRLLIQPEDSVELQLPVFENLRTLFLDECYLVGDDFLRLEPYLQKSPNLEKLTLRCSKVQRGYPLLGLMESYFGRDDPMNFMCENLRLTKIIYRHDDDAAPLLAAFLLSMSRSLPNNKIELIRIE